MGMLADSRTMVSNGPSAATSINAAGSGASGAVNLVDMVALNNIYYATLDQLKYTLTKMKAVTDPADPNLTLINNGLTAIGS